MLFESLKRLTEKKQPLTLDEKKWLAETINTKINLIGKEKLYALLVVHNKVVKPPNSSLEDPTDPFYDIEKLSVGLQLVWFEFTKMHLKSQNEIDFSNTPNK